MDRDLLVLLEELYSCVLSSERPRSTAACSARVLRACVCAPEPGCEGTSAPELCWVSLTVLELLLSRLTARSGAPEFLLFAEQTWSLIQVDVLDALLHRLPSEDQLQSHLNVMCMSAAVIYQLHHNGTLSGQWYEWCVQALCSPSSSSLDACVRSVTEVLRRQLKGGHHELTAKVQTALESSLSALCSQVLNVDKATPGTSCWELTVCLLLDLLEVLCACRTCVEGAALEGQCLLCMHSPELLSLCSSPLLQPAVRRRVLLLLKKVLVQRVGEDWTGAHQGQGCSDVWLLSRSVLRAVAEGWVKGVHVKGTNFFGGTHTVLPQVGPNVDSVSVRAVCLILLKSMELQCLSDTPEPVPIDLCLQSLWDTLQRASLPQQDPTVLLSGLSRHSCSWLSTVFGEQDDDMMEAAKALLCIFRDHRQQEPDYNPARLQLWACSWGVNPHCHFLLLLQGLAFDHRVLLDFLISSETCFLEYCVRYLRFLCMDQEGLRVACDKGCLELPPSRTASVGSAESQVRGLPLVDYTSSSESDTEMEMTSESDKAEARHLELSHWSLPCLDRAVCCLSQLREVVCRLHTKKLFPYNPTSLIKLLTEVEASMNLMSAN